MPKSGFSDKGLHSGIIEGVKPPREAQRLTTHMNCPLNLRRLLRLRLHRRQSLRRSRSILYSLRWRGSRSILYPLRRHGSRSVLDPRVSLLLFLRLLALLHHSIQLILLPLRGRLLLPQQPCILFSLPCLRLLLGLLIHRRGSRLWQALLLPASDRR